jgi:hypothetical protein
MKKLYEFGGAFGFFNRLKEQFYFKGILILDLMWQIFDKEVEICI